jgi:hypothetical protein
MVIVLHARAPLKKRGLLLSSRITVDQVAAALLNGVKGTPLAPVAASQKLDLPDHFAVTLHPAGGLVALRVMADHVEVLAKTSDVGAGYHAFLVSLLESAARDLGVAWEWDDKSGYVQHRDFARLQTRMAEFLKDLAAAPEEHGGSDSELAGCRINLDSDLEEVEADETEVLTPLGPKPVDEVLGWRSLDGAALARAAEDFFAWPGQGFDGGFYRGLMLYSLWNDIRWAYPIDPKEVELAKRTLRWFKAAADQGVIDPTCQPAVMEEISALILAKEDRVHFPRRDGVGYRRRMMRKRLGHGWTMTIPASLGIRFDADAPQTLVLLNHILEIRISLALAKSRRPLQPGEIDKRDKQIEIRDETAILNLAARALHTSDTDALCILTATLKDDQYLELVAQIADSLEYEPEEEEEEEEEEEAG